MVPEGWLKTHFSSIAKIGNGQVDPKVEPYASMIHIGPENVISNSGQLINLRTCKELELISGKYEFDENAIVYSKIRPNLNKVCRPPFKGVCSADMYPIWVEQSVDADFFLQYLLGPAFYKIAVSMSMRTGMPKINRADLDTVSVILPPLVEQKKIAQILSTWDKAIATTEKLLESSQKQKQALMQQLLSGKKRFPEFTEEWRLTKLNSLLKEEKIRNQNSSIDKVLSVTNHSGFVLPEDQFSKRVASENVSNYKIVKRGQYGYNPSRLNVGSFARLEEFEIGILSPMYVVFSINEEKLNSDYFYNWMQSNEAKQRINNSTQGSVRDSVGFDALTSFSIRLPSLDEQERIANVLNLSDKEIYTLQGKLGFLKEEKKALMQQLLTGKSRVRINS